jgi:hypothetical protein
MTYLKIIGLIFLVAVGAGAEGPVRSPAMAAGPAKIVCKEVVHDFGTVYEDVKLTYTFEVQNAGGETLEILDVDPDCECTVPSYDRRIPPGGQGKITLTIKPYSVLRKFRKETKIKVNDPDRPEVTLVLQGTALPFIEIQPSHVIRFRGRPDQDLGGKVRFISHLPGAWEIKEYRTDIPDKIEVAIRPEVPGKIYVVEVKNKYKEAGNYKGMIELFTTSKERPRLIMRIMGEIYSSAGSGP